MVVVVVVIVIVVRLLVVVVVVVVVVMFSKGIVIAPDNDWLRMGTDDQIRYPPLIYRRVKSIEITQEIIIGATWSVWCDSTPWFQVRRSIFENLFFPYKIPGLHLTVRHSALLWPRINLFAFTDLKQPRCVYIKSPRDFGLTVARFYFNDDAIVLDELEAASTKDGKEE